MHRIFRGGIGRLLESGTGNTQIIRTVGHVLIINFNQIILARVAIRKKISEDPISCGRQKKGIGSKAFRVVDMPCRQEITACWFVDRLIQINSKHRTQVKRRNKCIYNLHVRASWLSNRGV